MKMLFETVLDLSEERHKRIRKNRSPDLTVTVSIWLEEIEAGFETSNELNIEHNTDLLEEVVRRIAYEHTKMRLKDILK